MKNITSEFVVGINIEKLVIISEGVTKTIHLPSEIQQLEKFEKAIVVRVSPKAEHFLNENVFGISYSGQILWEIKKINHVYEKSPYTNIIKNNNFIKAHNWDGTDLIICPETGNILDKSYSK